MRVQFGGKCGNSPPLKIERRRAGRQAKLLFDRRENLLLIFYDSVQRGLIFQNGGLILFDGVLVGLDVVLVGENFLLVPQNLLLISDNVAL
jgi:hypothetical protein